MSLRLKTKARLTTEIKLQLLNVGRVVDNSLASVFPTMTPGYYKNALDLDRGLRWEKRFQMKIHFQALLFGPLMLLFGGYMIAQNSHDIMAMISIACGIAMVLLDGLTQHLKSEEQDERISKLEIKFLNLELRLNQN